jgi:thiol-disulfide isomerase/thioredoxin
METDMLLSRVVVSLLAGSAFITVVKADDPTSAALLNGLKIEAEKALADFNRGHVPGSSEAVQKRSREHYREREAEFVRRALALAEAHPESPEAPEALAFVFTSVLGSYSGKRVAECDAVVDVLAKRFANSDAILPVIETIWTDAAWAPQAGTFLKTMLDRSTNPTVKGAACFYLAKHQERLATARRFLDDPLRAEVARRNYGPDNIRRLRALDPAELKREAAALYEQRIKEHAALQLWGSALGDQAKGALFRMQNLDIGCTIPEIAGQDIDGRPMKLSDFRGKVVLVSFWATWCGPCMAMVPAEKDLVERLTGRPFVLIGVNGDDDRQRAKLVSAKKGINWRSFWDGGSRGATPSKWGVQSWPTTYVLDPKGVIRHDNLRGAELDKAVEALVTEAEVATKKP